MIQSFYELRSEAAALIAVIAVLFSGCRAQNTNGSDIDGQTKNKRIDYPRKYRKAL